MDMSPLEYFAPYTQFAQFINIISVTIFCPYSVKIQRKPNILSSKSYLISSNYLPTYRTPEDFYTTTELLFNCTKLVKLYQRRNACSRRGVHHLFGEWNRWGSGCSSIWFSSIENTRFIAAFTLNTWCCSCAWTHIGM